VKSVVESLSPTRAKLLVEVPFEELKPSLDRAYKDIASQVQVPGFRKGKVPAVIIDQRFGRELVLENAINDALPDLYERAVAEAEVTPLGQPDVDVTEISDGDLVKFTAEVDIRPDFELPEWEGLEVTVSATDVAESDVDAQLDELRGRFGTLTAVERAAQQGDFLVIDLDASRDGEPVPGAQASGMSYEVGSDTMIDGLDEAVLGLSAGESATFTSELAGDQEGVEADIEVRVTAVKERELPEADDDFAQEASEFDTLAELREDIREALLRSLRLGQVGEARDKVLDALLEATELPVPEGVVTRQIESHFSDGHGDDDHRAEIESSTRRSVKAQLVLDEIVSQQEVQVDQEDLTEYLIGAAQQQGMDPNEFAQQVVQSGSIPAVWADVARGKALALVMDKAVVTDESGQVVDIARVKEDGSLGDPEEVAATEATDTSEPTGPDDEASDAGLLRSQSADDVAAVGVVDGVPGETVAVEDDERA
jgi:trigger factor